MSNWYGWIALQQRREDGGKWRVLHHSGYCAATFDDKASAKAEAQRLNDAHDSECVARAALERPRPAPPEDSVTYPRPEPLRNEEMPDREWSDYEWVRNQWYLADEHWKEVQAEYDAALKEIAQLEQALNRLLAKNARYRAALEEVAFVAGGKAAERIRRLLYG